MRKPKFMNASAAPATTSDNTVKQSVYVKVMQDDTPEELKSQCLATALYEVTKSYTFFGGILQVMNIMYSYQLPTAGVTFNADLKRYEMYINPRFFCRALNDKQRVAVLVHEVMHITNKHLIRVPFFKVSDHKRRLLNIAGDMSINQCIKNLPAGCPECPSIEEQQQGAQCQNELCCGKCIDVNDWYDEDEATKKKTQWPKNKTMEDYFEKLMEKYEEPPDDKPEQKIFKVEYVFVENLDVTPNGKGVGKTLTAVTDGVISTGDIQVKVGDEVLVAGQVDPVDNGVYTIEDTGSDTTPFILKRVSKHDGSLNNEANIEDIAIDKHLKPKKGEKPKGWVLVGQAKNDFNPLVEVDKVPMTWEEKELNGKGGSGLPREFDSHNWDAAADETEVIDATEELVKRAMIKQNLSYDDLPGSVKTLLDELKARRAELNYRALILSAIKRSASGHDRKSTWTRTNKRFGNKAPGTKTGDMPKMSMELDTSGSISVEECNEFLDIVDEFLKVGSRKCFINLFSDCRYFHAKYKIGQRDFVRKNVKMGGTCLESTLKCILEDKCDLNIIVTDGYYGDVNFESWLKPGQQMPQILWIISKNGTADHPLKRLGETIKIPNHENKNK
jgi:predicted metal-dependent peptidase